MAKVEVYTKDYCPFCTRAKALLTDRGIAFTEIDISQWSSEKIAELYSRSGMRTVPQIFANDVLIGGYTELADRDQKQGLKDLA